MEPWDGGRVEVVIVGADLHLTVIDRDNTTATAVLSPDEADDLSAIIREALRAE
jgi:hypothetical protein